VPPCFLPMIRAAALYLQGARALLFSARSTFPLALNRVAEGSRSSFFSQNLTLDLSSSLLHISIFLPRKLMLRPSSQLQKKVRFSPPSGSALPAFLLAGDSPFQFCKQPIPKLLHALSCSPLPGGPFPPLLPNVSPSSCSRNPKPPVSCQHLFSHFIHIDLFLSQNYNEITPSLGLIFLRKSLAFSPRALG